MAERSFPDWDALYRQQPAETMPWYHPGLEAEVVRLLEEKKLTAGRALDLGAGPGTQAIALAERGFTVTATDISEAAVQKASKRVAGRGLPLRFVQDDVLHSRLKGPFDLVCDRGCFHVLEPAERDCYAQTVASLLAPAGLLLLQCFSDEQPGTQGPHRISPAEIRATFEPLFEVVSIERTTFSGNVQPSPKALFCVLRRRAG